METREKKKTSQSTRIAITGGIGSGKSYVCQRLEQMGFPVFYCDREAKRIIRQSPEVKKQLTALVGEQVYDAEGALNKKVLAHFICQSQQDAEKVDAIVHPQVAKAFEQWAEEQTMSPVFMECALLYESGFDRLVDRVALVVVDEAIRLRRVMQRDSINEEKARAWMALQMPEDEKAARADAIIRNYENEEALLAADIAKLLGGQETAAPTSTVTE